MGELNLQLQASNRYMKHRLGPLFHLHPHRFKRMTTVLCSFNDANSEPAGKGYSNIINRWRSRHYGTTAFSQALRFLRCTAAVGFASPATRSVTQWCLNFKLQARSESDSAFCTGGRHGPADHTIHHRHVTPTYRVSLTASTTYDRLPLTHHT